MIIIPILSRSVTKNVYKDPKWGSRVKACMALYNFVMMTFSAYCAVAMIQIMKEDYWTPAVTIDKFHTVVYAFYISKYVEFLDTIFLILKCQPVSWLQYYHHFGAPLAMGALYFSELD